jgi:hypothetical protein
MQSTANVTTMPLDRWSVIAGFMQSPKTPSPGMRSLHFGLADAMVIVVVI